MASFEKVVEGLKAGKSFERKIDGDRGGVQYLVPLGNDQVRLEVHASTWGNYEVYPLELLCNGKKLQRNWWKPRAVSA